MQRRCSADSEAEEEVKEGRDCLWIADSLSRRARRPPKPGGFRGINGLPPAKRRAPPIYSTTARFAWTPVRAVIRKTRGNPAPNHLRITT
jgi:hypothetical protein